MNEVITCQMCGEKAHYLRRDGMMHTFMCSACGKLTVVPFDTAGESPDPRLACLPPNAPFRAGAHTKRFTAYMAGSHDLFRTLLTIRLVEERLQAMCMRGEAGDLHFSRGQEAIAVGVCAALRPTDHIVTHHRTIAHEIAKACAMYNDGHIRAELLYGLVAEILGKKTGVNGGVAGEMHISNAAIRHDFSFQLVGTCVPVAVGIAYAQKYFHKNDEIVAVFFGDAASSNGQVHEALTVASIHKVPLLLVCENNGLAGNVTKEHYLPTKTVGERMMAYGIPYGIIDGNDVRSVEGNTKLAAAWIRDGGGPMMLECNTLRACHHKQGQGDIRPKEWIAAELAKRDPIDREQRAAGISDAERAAIHARIEAELDEVFARVAEDPLPEVTLGT